MNKSVILAIGILAMLVGSSCVIPEANAQKTEFGPEHNCAGDLDHECTHRNGGANETCAVWVANACV